MTEAREDPDAPATGGGQPRQDVASNRSRQPSPRAASSRERSDEPGAELVPLALRKATAYAWRVALLAIAVVAVLFLLAKLVLVVVPVIAALFLAGLLEPGARALRGLGLPDATAAAAMMLAGLVALGGLGYFVVPSVADQLTEVGFSASQGLERVGDFLVGVLPVSQSELQSAVQDAVDSLQAALIDATTFIGAARIVAEVAVGIFITLFVLFFLLKDGRRFHRWVSGLFPAHRRAEVEEVMSRSWRTLEHYPRGIVIVGLADAAFIGLALVLIGVPLVVPLMVLTFFGAFFPLVGAVVAGAVAALVALVSGGAVDALLVVGAVLIVQQLESNLLYPLVMRREVEVHPAVTLLAVTAGGILAGIVGAFVAVPVAAVIQTVGRCYRSRPWEAPTDGSPSATAGGE